MDYEGTQWLPRSWTPSRHGSRTLSQYDDDWGSPDRSSRRSPLGRDGWYGWDGSLGRAVEVYDEDRMYGRDIMGGGMTDGSPWQRGGRNWGLSAANASEVVSKRRLEIGTEGGFRAM